MRDRIEASQDSNRKVLSSIDENMRTVSRDTELLRFSTSNDTQKSNTTGFDL